MIKNTCWILALFLTMIPGHLALAYPVIMFPYDLQSSDESEKSQEALQKKITVGQLGRIDQVVIPGSELERAPITDPDAKFIIQSITAYPHGSAWRYDIEYYGLEPGTYNVVEFLKRKDGSSLEDLKPVEVNISSILEPGHILPNDLQQQPLPWLGGYRVLMIAAIFLWCAVMLLIIFGWRKKSAEQIAREKYTSFAEYLRPRILAAKNGELNSRGFAELERMLTEYWKRKLGVGDLPAVEALGKITADEDAGPIFQKMEDWLHNPNPDRNISVEALLEPYENVDLDEVDIEIQPHQTQAI